MGSVASSKAVGGSWGRGEAGLKGSFLWKWLNVTLPRVRVRTGTAGGMLLLSQEGISRDLENRIFLYRLMT